MIDVVLRCSRIFASMLGSAGRQHGCRIKRAEYMRDSLRRDLSGVIQIENFVAFLKEATAPQLS